LRALLIHFRRLAISSAGRPKRCGFSAARSMALLSSLSCGRRGGRRRGGREGSQLGVSVHCMAHAHLVQCSSVRIMLILPLLLEWLYSVPLAACTLLWSLVVFPPHGWGAG
jgi:hypothetical protein